MQHLIENGIQLRLSRVRSFSLKPKTKVHRKRHRTRVDARYANDVSNENFIASEKYDILMEPYHKVFPRRRDDNNR